MVFPNQILWITIFPPHKKNGKQLRLYGVTIIENNNLNSSHLIITTHHLGFTPIPPSYIFRAGWKPRHKVARRFLGQERIRRRSAEEFMGLLGKAIIHGRRGRHLARSCLEFIESKTGRLSRTAATSWKPSRHQGKREERGRETVATIFGLGSLKRVRTPVINYNLRASTILTFSTDHGIYRWRGILSWIIGIDRAAWESLIDIPVMARVHFGEEFGGGSVSVFGFLVKLCVLDVGQIFHWILEWLTLAPTQLPCYMIGTKGRHLLYVLCWGKTSWELRKYWRECTATIYI